MPRFIEGPITSLRFTGSDGIEHDLTDMVRAAPDRPERGVPYSVSWYEGDARYARRDRVYLVRIDQDPHRFVIIDTLTGEELTLAPESMPLFRAPTAAAPHRW